MDENIEKLWDDFNKATVDLKKNACQDAKAVHRYETIYGATYQKLVKAGLMPKLRLKYRPLY